MFGRFEERWCFNSADYLRRKRATQAYPLKIVCNAAEKHLVITVGSVYDS